MTGPAEDFAAAVPGVKSAETVRQGAFLHQYHAELTAKRGTVRILTLAPERDDDAVEQAFRLAAGQWHNPSSHPSIVTVHERGREPRPWIATELPLGGPLDAVQADLSIPDGRAVLKETAEAIRNANLYNSMYLALEPRAVYVDTTDDEPSVQIDEWGLERACRVAADETPVSPFTAPEQLDDPDGGTEQTDVYGLGAVAYYALTGQPPITGGASLACVVLNREITPPSEHAPAVSEAGDRVVLTALSTRPTDRQDSAFAFKTSITQALPSEPPSEPAPEEETDAEGEIDGDGEDETLTADETTESEPGDSQDESMSPQAENDESGGSVSRRATLGLLGLGGVGALGAGGWYLAQLWSRPASGAPMFQYNLANTGHATDEIGPTDTITERWTYTTGASVESSPAVVDGTVYIGSADGTVHALDATNGTEQWAFDTGGGVRSSPAVVDGTVYVGSLDNSIYALDAAVGTEQWTFNTGDKVFSSPAVVDGTVYVGSRDHTVYALSAADGSEQWAFQTDDWVNSSPAVVDGTVYVGSDDGNVYALSAADGTEQWVFETGGGVNSSPAVVDRTVYIGSEDNTVYALDATNGTEQWVFETGDSVYSSPAVVDGTVYVGSHDNHVYTLDAADGTEQWAFDAKAWVYSSPAVVDGIVYVGSAKYAQGNVPLRPEIFNMYALDAVDGTEQWTYESVAQVFSSPAVVDGTVYVGSNDHNVYALTEQ